MKHTVQTLQNSSLWVRICVVATGALLCISSFGVAQNRASDFHELVNDTFSLKASNIVALEIEATVGVEFSVTLPLAGVNYTLDLAPYSIRSENYRVLVSGADDTDEQVEAGPVRTLRGTVVSIPGSSVAGSLLDDGLHAVIQFPDGERHWVQPIAEHVAGAQADQHVIYLQSDVIPSGGICGNDFSAMRDQLEQSKNGRAAAGIDECGVTELACDADQEYFNTWGSGVEDRINLVINIVNQQYEEDVDITHEIVAILIHLNPGSDGDPYQYTSTDPVALLTQYRSHWLNFHTGIQRDVNHLFTGKNINGGVIGIAWTIGAICTNNAFCLSQSDCCSPNLPCATDLTAHELGHLWGAFHCNPCNETMRSFIGCFNNFNQVVNQIVAHRNSRTCLDCPETASAPLPLVDEFPEIEIDEALWVGIDGALTSNLGLNEPSPGRSLNLDGNAIGGDAIRTAFLDTSNTSDLVVQYWYEAGGPLAPPGVGDDLIVEYFNASGSWIEIDRQFGNGVAMTEYLFSSVALPPAANHSNFRIQIRVTSDSDAPIDDWFVDDFCVGENEACQAMVPCPADVNGDGVIDAADLALLLGAWGVQPSGHAADLNDDIVVDAADLAILLGAWGPCS